MRDFGGEKLDLLYACFTTLPYSNQKVLLKIWLYLEMDLLPAAGKFKMFHYLQTFVGVSSL